MNAIIIALLIILNICIVYRRIKSIRDLKSIFFLILIFLIHYLTFILFYNLSITIQRDSFLFYQNALEAQSILEFELYGGQLMSIIVYPFAKSGVSYLTLSLMFSTISFCGFLNYYNFVFTRMNKNKWLFIIALFLLIPSLHFWTSGLTKEALIFYFMSVIFISLYNKQRLTVIIFFSGVFIFLIRPYMFFIMGFGFFLNYILYFNASSKKKIRTLIYITITFIVLAPVLLKFLHLNELGFESIKYNFSLLIDYSKNFGESSIDLKKSSYLERLYLVLFRPFFYDATTINQYLISCENVIVFIFLMKSLIEIFNKKLMLNSIKNELFLFVTVLLTILFYSIYMYNLGLASRMRVMFIPYMFIFLFLAYNKKYKIE